jgi:hypothetical protein
MPGDIPNDTCALCGQQSPLRQSHIIPEFLYSPLYDEKRRFKTYGKVGQPRVDLEQKGFREPLLCEACEQRFSDNERFAAVFYRGTVQAFSSSTPEVYCERSLKFTRVSEQALPTSDAVPSMLHVEGINYDRLKLFLLSVIWRMGVSRLHFFREVELGKHEDRLRHMLLSDDPGEPKDYPCQMCLVEADGRLLTDYQSQPRRFRSRGRWEYRFYSTGIRFDFSISNRSIEPELLKVYCLKREPTFTWCVDSLHKHPDLRQEIIEFGQRIGCDKTQDQSDK